MLEKRRTAAELCLSGRFKVRTLEEAEQEMNAAGSMLGRPWHTPGLLPSSRMVR